MTALAPAPRLWLFGPRSDLLFGCGLLYALVFGLFLVAGAGLRSAQPAWLAALLVLGIGTPHYGATLLRVYERRRDRSGYVLFSLWATLVVAALFIGGLWIPAIGSFLVTLYLSWSPWHYTGQNYGIAVMFLRRGGVALDPRVKRWLYLSFLLSFALVFVGMHTADAGASDLPTGYVGEGVRFAPLGIPPAWSVWIALGLLAAYAVALARAAWGLRRGARLALLPAALLTLSQVLWFSLPYGLHVFGAPPGLDVLDWQFRTHYFLWIAAAHSLQYLWVTAYYARQAGGWHGQLFNYLRVLAAGAAVWTLPLLVFGPQSFGPLSFDLGLATLVAAAVNVHHFILDGAIWKLRGKIAEILIRSGSESADSERSARPWLRRTVWAVCAAALLVNVFGVATDHVFVREMTTGRYAEAARSAEWLAWVGRDRVVARRSFGEALLRDRHFGDARIQLERGESLAPSSTSRILIGLSYEGQGEYREAAESYESALGLEPPLAPEERATTLRRAGGARLAAGEPEKALALLEAALALAPEAADVRSLLERARLAAARPPAS